MLNLSKFLEEIAEHFEAEYPREGCGVIGLKKGKLYWIPCKNIAEDEEDFVFDSVEYFEIRKTHEILAIIHSHPDASCEPSIGDRNNCNALGIPYYIFSYPSMEMYELLPTEYKKPLVGREYKFGVSDCFEAMRDCYKEQDIHLPKREPFEDDWWLKGLDYFTEDYLKEWGFKKVDSPKKNDLLIFAVNTKIGSHCGVYLGRDIFFHHAENRLSCKENLYPFWIKYLIGIYRYEA